jgi:hypothetical protein
MPTDDSLGLHDDEEVAPSGPQVPQGGPEESVQEIQGWSGMFPLQDGDLLAQSEDFESGVPATT